MSQATKELLMKVRKMVPPMLEKFHKGTLEPCRRYETGINQFQDKWVG